MPAEQGALLGTSEGFVTFPKKEEKLATRIATAGGVGRASIVAVSKAKTGPEWTPLLIVGLLVLMIIFYRAWFIAIVIYEIVMRNQPTYGPMASKVGKEIKRSGDVVVAVTNDRVLLGRKSVLGDKLNVTQVPFELVRDLGVIMGSLKTPLFRIDFTDGGHLQLRIPRGTQEGSFASAVARYSGRPNVYHLQADAGGLPAPPPAPFSSTPPLPPAPGSESGSAWGSLD